MPGSKQYFPPAILEQIGEGPPKPSGDPDENRDAYRAYREWAQQGFDLLERMQKGGKTLKDLGASNTAGQGKSLFDRENFISAYGQNADAKWIYDPVHNRKKKAPGAGGGTDYKYGGTSNSGKPMESGGWIPMEPGELGNGYSGGYENFLGGQGRKEMMKYGHLNKDPVTGMFFNIGQGNPQDPTTWQWVDQNNHPTNPPSPQQAQQVLQANNSQVTGAGGQNFGSNSPFNLPEGYSFPTSYNPSMLNQLGGQATIDQLLQQAMMFGGGNAQFQRQIQNLIDQGTSRGPTPPGQQMTPQINPPRIGNNTGITPPVINNTSSIQAPNINPALSSQPVSPFSTSNPSLMGQTKPKPLYSVSAQAPQQPQPDDFGALFTPKQSQGFLSKRTSSLRPFSPGRMSNNPFGI